MQKRKLAAEKIQAKLHEIKHSKQFVNISLTRLKGSKSVPRTNFLNTRKHSKAEVKKDKMIKLLQSKVKYRNTIGN